MVTLDCANLHQHCKTEIEEGCIEGVGSKIEHFEGYFQTDVCQ